MAVDVGSAVGYLDLDISGFLAGLKSAQDEAGKSSKSIGDKFTGIGKSMSSAGSTLTKNVTLPLAGISVAGLKVATDFEKGMSEVRAISGAAGKDFDALREKAIELGADTAFSSNEVASAMTEMAKAGWDSQQIIDGMSGVLAAAAASGEGLASTSTIVADAITGFGMEASESTKVADLLTQAANSGTIGINDLGESFKYIAPVAGAMDLSIEDCTTAISAMSMAGIKGSQAGTALRTMLTNLIKPTDKMAASMEQLGIQATNQDGSMKSLDEIVANLRNGFSGLSESEKAYHAATLAGKEGMSGMLALLNLTEEEYNEIAESMDNAGGVAEETAAVMQDNLKSKVEQLGGALESLAIKLADYVIPYLQQFVVWLTNLIDKFSNLNPSAQKTILIIGGIAAAAGPVLFATGKLITGIGGFVTALGKIPGVVSKVKTGFNTLTTGLKNVGEGFTAAKAGYGNLATAAGGAGTKIGASLAAVPPFVWIIIAIIAALTAAFVTLWKNNEEFRNKIKEIWGGIVDMFKNFFAQITEKINSLGFNFENFGEVLKSLWNSISELFGPLFIALFQGLSDTFKAILDGILATVSFFIAIFKGDWKGAWEAVKDLFMVPWNFIVNFIKNIVNSIIGVVQVILSWFGVEWKAGIEDAGNTFKNIWQSVADFFTNLWNGIWAVIGPLFEEIIGTFQMAWDSIKLIWEKVQPFFAAIWEGIKAVFSVVGIWFQTIFSVAWELIKGIWNMVGPYFKLIWENIKAVFSVVGAVLSGFFKVAWEAIKAIWNTVVSYFTLVWAGIKAVFAVVKGILSGNFTDAWEAIKNVWNKAKDFFKSIWDGIKNVFGSTVTWFKDVFSKTWAAIKNVFSNFGSFFSGLWNTIKNTFTNLGTKIGSAIGNAVKAGINGVIGMIENTVNGFIGLINGAINLINKIPGVSIGKIGRLSFPRLAKGGIVTAPTFAQIGEDGTEAVVPLEKNLGWMKKLANEFVERLGSFFIGEIHLDRMYELLSGILNVGRQLAMEGAGYTPYNGFTKQRQGFNKQPERGSEPGNGDTFIFNSPKPISEIEAAKQMKKAKRDLAEGF